MFLLLSILPKLFLKLFRMPPLSAPNPSSPDDRNAVAKVWMKRGIALLSANDATALPEALNCFEQALAIRRELPFEASAWYRWLLTACWMNRGDVLTRLGKPADLTAAVKSFDEAIFHLQKLPLEEDSQYRGRLALAWMNRSLALRAQATPESLHAALLSLDHGKTVIEESVTKGLPVNTALLPILIINRAALLLEASPPRMLEAMQEAEEALTLCQPTEHLNLQAGEIGLKARHIFCRAVALLLETSSVDTTRADDWIMQATDKVDEAMQLTATWENQKEAGPFHALRHELFRYGCNLLLAYQPHFMAEFLLDVLDPEQGSPLLAKADDLYQTGLEALDLAAAEMRRRGPLDLGLQKMDRLIEVLESMSLAAERIKKRSAERNA
jgi:tetratricopeptide (TPR) repeat protein